ncbi:GNAT family protein [Clostridium sp. 'deep sea']|uniref:GNAT family N-acetyltransferase n=1 Tax=Clostridium sp. 'deep sea' TaxID=2779445 RepID=UPI001A9A91B9|nr:GNAT family protein [Clostridium sp. 'deep sea']
MINNIAGEKVILRPLETAKDLDFIVDVETNKDLWYYEEYVKEDKQKTRELFIKRMRPEVKNFDFIISRKNDNTKTAIGVAYTWLYSEYRKSYEIGYVILPQYQKQGFGCDATKSLLKFAFEQLKTHKVVGMCNANNVGSATIMQKVGMRKEAVFKEELFWNNKWTDQYFFAILESEYFNK